MEDEGRPDIPVDPAYRLHDRVIRAGAMLVAAGAPVDDRRELHTLYQEAKGLLPCACLRPTYNPGPDMASSGSHVERALENRIEGSGGNYEEVRQSCIAHLSLRLQAILDRNSICLDAPLAPEIKPRFDAAMAARERNIQLAADRLESLDAQLDDVRLTMMEGRFSDLEELRNLEDQLAAGLREYNDMLAGMELASFLGPPDAPERGCSEG